MKRWKLVVGGALGRLRQFLIRRVGHISSQLNKDGLHCVVSAPVREAGKLARVDHAVSWVNAGQVHFVDELDGRRLVGILVATMHLEGIDPILVNAVWRAKDCAIPV